MTAADMLCCGFLSAEEKPHFTVLWNGPRSRNQEHTWDFLFLLQICVLISLASQRRDDAATLCDVLGFAVVEIPTR